jgi:hypothetical protein
MIVAIITGPNAVVCLATLEYILKVGNPGMIIRNIFFLSEGNFITPADSSDDIIITAPMYMDKFKLFNNHVQAFREEAQACTASQMDCSADFL